MIRLMVRTSQVSRKPSNGSKRDNDHKPPGEEEGVDDVSTQQELVRIFTSAKIPAWGYIGGYLATITFCICLVTWSKKPRTPGNPRSSETVLNIA